MPSSRHTARRHPARRYSRQQTGLGFRVFRVQGSGFGVWGLGLGFGGGGAGVCIFSNRVAILGQLVGHVGMAKCHSQLRSIL